MADRSGENPAQINPQINPERLQSERKEERRANFEAYQTRRQFSKVIPVVLAEEKQSNSKIKSEYKTTSPLKSESTSTIGETLENRLTEKGAPSITRSNRISEEASNVHVKGRLQVPGRKI